MFDETNYYFKLRWLLDVWDIPAEWIPDGLIELNLMLKKLGEQYIMEPQQVKLNDWQWIETFYDSPHEIKTILIRQINLLKSKEVELAVDRKHFNQTITDYNDGWLLDYAVGGIDKELAVLQQKIKKLEFYVWRIDNPQTESKGNGITDYDIEQAKQVSVVELVQPIAKLRQSGSNWVCLCPLHRERSPSFIIFGKNNHWKCFGCNASGDSIEFVKRYYGMTFIQAIKFILHK